MKWTSPTASMEHNLLLKILEYAWIPIIAMVAWIMKKLSLHDTNIKLLEQTQIQCDKTRDEDVSRNEKAHKQLMEALNTHHSTVMGRLDVLAGKDK